MGYKTIAVIVTDSRTDGPALIQARDLAQREDAHLDVHCLAVDASRYDALPAGASAILLETGAEEAREQAQSLVKWAENLLGRDIARVAVTAVVSPQLGVDAALGRLVRYADLVVATKPYGAERNALHVLAFEAALFASGAAVMVVPRHGMLPDAGLKRIAVAWNESDESLRAIRAALPMLRRAGRVDVVMVDPPSHSSERSDPGGQICMMLARHGVKAEVSILSRTMYKVSDVVARFAAEHEVELIVMGAYGHSRLREALLGGATRELLEQTELPLLMAH